MHGDLLSFLIPVPFFFYYFPQAGAKHMTFHIFSEITTVYSP